MKTSIPKLVVIIYVGAIILSSIACGKAESINEAKPGDEMNPTMSADQKAINAAHKNRPVH